MRKILVLAALTTAWLSACAPKSGGDVIQTTVRVQKIWDNGTHAAFTSLIKFKGRYFCSFREGYSHIFDAEGNAEGHVRILSSKDGKSWKSIADFGLAGVDLRDPKLSITPDGRLMVTIGGSVYRDRKLVDRIPQVCFSTDGEHFSDPQPIQLDPPTDCPLGEWLWRVTWNEGVGYGMSYYMNHLRLLSTTDGVHYSTVCRPYPDGAEGKVSETTLRFLPDGRMVAIVRRDPTHVPAALGVAAAPYTDWTWRDLPTHIGGPDFLVRPDGSFLVGGRAWVEPGVQCKTVLWSGTVDGPLSEVYLLPSAGDNSYPGLLIEGDELWLSYYSCCGELSKTGVFLARVPLSLFENQLVPVNCNWE